MKVQFAPGRMRVRVDRAEFDRLRSGATLVLDVARWAVHLEATDAFGLNAQDDRLVLGLPAGALEELAARLPSRDGIEAVLELGGRPLAIAFEVDLRDARPRRPR